MGKGTPYKREHMAASKLEMAVLEAEVQKLTDKLEQKQQVYDAVVQKWEQEKQNTKDLYQLSQLQAKQLRFWKITSAVALGLLVLALLLLGTFRLTAYCACVKCCGKEPGDPAYGITASGERVKENWTVAADPEVIPIGTLIQINGQVYRVEDVGGLVKGNTVDIYMATHEAALDFGVQEAEVFILEGGNN